MGNRLLLVVCLVAVLFGCGAKEPLKIGFIGGLSDRNTDVGESGYKAVVLAVEQINRAGGINGRPVELVARDDAQNPETAAKSAAELAQQNVVAVVGPFTSGMAAAVMPVFEKASLVTISPTVTSMDFFARDDYLIRINRTTRDNARDYARVLSGRGQSAISLAYDTRNRSFTESWLKEFRQAFAELGGRVPAEIPFESSPDADFDRVTHELLAAKPDGLLFIAGATDVARLAQLARRSAPALPISASEWAASEQLLQLGGKVVDGLLIVLNFNRDDDSPRYVAFREAFFNRFQAMPSYSAVLAYDAATVLFAALAKRQKDETAKAAILRYGPYEGLQQQIAFDAFGDTPRKVFFSEIRDGRFVLLK
jgi:branched-chain amino acid transport system substrate-binding protein